MLKRFWRWFWGPPGDPADSLSAPFAERVEELEDRYDRLERRFIRLQGEFTALTRAEFTGDEDEEEDT